MAGRFFSRLWQRREPQRSTGKDAHPALRPMGQPGGTLSMVANVAPHPWPRLSESLTGPRQPDTCQSCGATNVQLVPSADPGGEMSPIAADDTGALHARLRRVLDAEERGVHVWQERDDADQPEPIAVLLCPPCSARLIEPHPRLYYGLPFNEPFAGTMGLCVPCRFRDGVRCTHPDLRANGGPGLIIQADTPIPAPGRRRVCVRAAMGCAGREQRKNALRSDTVSTEAVL